MAQIKTTICDNCREEIVSGTGEVYLELRKHVISDPSVPIGFMLSTICFEFCSMNCMADYSNGIAERVASEEEIALSPDPGFELAPTPDQMPIENGDHITDLRQLQE